MWRRGFGSSLCRGIGWYRILWLLCARSMGFGLRCTRGSKWIAGKRREILRSAQLTTPLLFHKLGLFAFVPRIVGQAEADAVWDGRVGIEHEDSDGTGSGIGEIHFAENLKGLRGDLAGTRN